MGQKNSFDENVSMMNSVRTDGYIWFIDEKSNNLFRMKDDFSESIEYITYDKENYGLKNTYKWIAKWKNTIVFIPRLLQKKLFIDKELKSYHSDAVKVNVGDKNIVVRDCMQQEQYIYLFTDNEEYSIIEYDIVTDTCEIIMNWMQLCQKSEVGMIAWKVGQPQILDKNIWMGIQGTNIILRLCISNKETTVYRIRNEKFGWALQGDTGIIWALNETNEKILKMNIENMGGKEIQSEATNISEYVSQYGYNMLWLDKQFLYLLPNADVKIVRIDLKNNISMELDYPEEFEWIKDLRYKSGLRFKEIETTEKEIILYPRVGNGILFVNRKSGEMNYKPLAFDMKNLIRSQLEEVDINNIKLWEYDLDLFLEMVCRSESTSESENAGGFIGKDIWRKCYKY